MPVSVQHSALGIAKETTPGTAVAPSFWLPVTDMTATENIAELLAQEWRGSAAKTYDAQAGVTDVAYEFKGNAYPDSIGWPLVGVLGDDAVTGASAPYTHTASLLNSGTQQTPTYTLTDVNGVDTNGVAYAGMMFHSLELSFAADGMLTYTAQAVGRSAAAGGSAPTPSFTTPQAIANWLATVSIDGSATSLIEDATFTIARSADPVHTLTGTQSPNTVFAGGDLEYTFKMTSIFEAATFRDRFRNGTKGALVVSLTRGASAAQIGLTLTATQAFFNKAEVTRGKNWVELDIEGRGLANTTDAGTSGGSSPVKAVLMNAQASGVYK